MIEQLIKEINEKLHKKGVFSEIICTENKLTHEEHKRQVDTFYKVEVNAFGKELTYEAIECR